ncbi:serine palmitoyltransferase 2 [Cyathus striatus]|nr:serine palmitoyltransferase 2 [Cyathus striatus]
MPSNYPPSPMAINKPSQPSIFKKRSNQNFSPTTAASYLSALSEADARARNKNPNAKGSPTSTPALSYSSSITSSSEDTVLYELDNDSYEDGLSLPAQPPTSEQVFTTVHTEFGHCSNEEYRLTSQHTPGTPVPGHEDHDPPYYILLSTYVSYLILIVIGHMRDFVGKRIWPSSYKHLIPRELTRKLLGICTSQFRLDSFYTRRLKTRMDECFSQPVTGVAGRTIVLLDRISPDYNYTQIFTGTRTRALNISSYNYLGFAQARGGCADAVEESIKRYGISSCGSRLEGGSTDLHTVSEALVAKFLGMEDALISSMGFATNSTIIPALVGKGCLVISDELNHTSIRFGVRISGANVRMFKHNDMNSLESLLKEVISQGQPKTHRPWKKILVIVEGLYSMEGTLVNLPVIMELKQKYKFYLFVDEAHSIGALGPHGRGVADYFGINPRSIDILMGTFTKSFGAAGGYIAGTKAIIDRLRVHGHTGPYAEAMSPPVLTQIVSSMASIMGIVNPTSALHNGSNSTPKLIMAQQEEYNYPGPASPSSLPTWLDLPHTLASGAEGASRIRRLAFNCRYLHNGLNKLGFITYGHPCSPIVPLLLFNPGKMNMFHRMMKARQTPIVVVVICVSAAHTKDDIDTVLRACDEIGDVLDLKHGIPKWERWGIEDVVDRAVELARMV